MKVSVLGMGGVGYAVANILAASEIETIGVDIDSKAIEHPRTDKSTRDFIERHQKTIEQHLVLTMDYEKTRDSHIGISLVNTDFDGKQLLTNAVESSIEAFGKVNSDFPLLMVSATLPFGASRKLVNQCKKLELDYCYNPVMVIQGNYVKSYLEPPFLAFGATSQPVAMRALSLYSVIFKRFEKLLPPFFVISPAEAELIKMSANAFLSTKMSYANHIGEVCETINSLGVFDEPMDARVVLKAIGCDPRIGGRFLYAGYAFGGNCFPRDLRSLITSIEELAMCSPELLEATESINERRVKTPVSAMAWLKPILGEPPLDVAVFGIAYKAGIEDERGSKAKKLVKHMKDLGYNVSQYDPSIGGRQKSAGKMANAEVIIVTTTEPLFENIGDMVSERCKAVLDFTTTGIVNTERLPKHVHFFRAGQGWLLPPKEILFHPDVVKHL